MDWFVVWHMKEGIICCLIWKLQGSQIMLSCQTSLVTLVPYTSQYSESISLLGIFGHSGVYNAPGS